MLLAVIGVVLLLLYGMLRQRPLAFPECVKQAQDQHNQEPEYQDCAMLSRFVVSIARAVDTYHDDIAAISTLIIAIYTIILGRATIGLRDIAFNQHRDQVEATRAAIMTAQAAKESADAAQRMLTEVERPWLFINLGAFVRADAVPVPGTEMKHLPVVTFTLSNYGRVPATIEEFFAGAGSANSPSNLLVPRPDWHETIAAQFTQPSASLPFFDNVQFEQTHGTFGPGFPIAKETEEIFAVFFIRYTGTNPKQVYTTRACWRWSQTRCRFVQHADEKYNYRD